MPHTPLQRPAFLRRGLSQQTYTFAKMQQEHEEEQPHQWARSRPQTSQRDVSQEHRHMRGQQLKQEERHQSESRAVAEPQVHFSETVQEAHHPVEHERQRHTASRRGSFRAAAPERWQLHTHAETPQRTVALASAQQQHGNHSCGGIHPMGVDCNVPFISSAAPLSPHQEQKRPEFFLSPVTVATSSSLPDVPALRESEKNSNAAKLEAERAVREDEDDQSYSHSTRGSSGNSNRHHLGGFRRGEHGEGELEESLETYTPPDGADRLHVAENVFDLHAADGGFVDAAGRSRSLAATQRKSIVSAAAAPSEEWECTLRDDGVASDHPDSVALPSFASPFYCNVLSAEATSDSGGSVTSPSTSPATALSPHAVSPATPASPVSVLSARHSPALPYAVPVIGFSHGLPLSPVLSSAPTMGATPPAQAHTGQYLSSTSPAVPRPYEQLGARSRGRTASQQARSHPHGHEGVKQRSSSTGGGHSYEPAAGPLYNPNYRSPLSASASSPHHFSGALLSPFATSYSTSSSRTSPTAPASPSLSPPAAARISTDSCRSEEASRMRDLSSPVLLTPVTGVGELFAPRGHRHSSWGRQLDRREDPFKVLVDNCIYREENLEHPNHHPVPLPNGESLSHSPFLHSPKSQKQEVLLDRTSPPDWTGPIALPYNTEEAPPSPFSRARSRSRSGVSIWDEDRGISHVTHKRGSITSALAAMRVPTHFLPPHYLSATRSRRACDAALDHADFSPPSPFFPSSSHSSTQETWSAADRQCSAYPQFSARTCVVHKQPHTFVYPFDVAEAAIPSAARASPSTALFHTWPHSTTSEPQQVVPTYYISNNGMGQTVPYNSRGIASHKAKRAGPAWLRWLWPWGRDNSTKSTQEQQRDMHPLETQPAAALPRSGSVASSSAPSTLPLPVSSRTHAASPLYTSEQDRSADSSRKRGGVHRFPSFLRDDNPPATAVPTGSFAADRRAHSTTQGGSCRQPSSRNGKTKRRLGGGGGRGTFVLAAVSAALEIGCVWRFPSYCFRFGGATFLVAYVVLLAVLGLPILALEMALGQVFRGGQMKVLNLISPRLRGLAAATLLLSFFICAYYSIFVSWALQFLVSSARASLPWAITSQDAAICSAAGHDPAACIQATLPTPPLFTEKMQQKQQQRWLGGDGTDHHLEGVGQRRLSAQQIREGTTIQQEENKEQSFCAWKKPFSSNAEGVCVADDKLKARVFLYTDVLGIWEKKTEHPSAVREIVPPPPVTSSGNTGPHPSSHPSPLPPSIPPSSSRLAPLKLEPKTSSSSSASHKDHEKRPATGLSADRTEPAELTGSEGVTADVTPPAIFESTAAVAGERKNTSSKSVQQPDSSAALTYRKLASSSPAPPPNPEEGLPPYVTSVTRATSAWSIAPLLAVGLVAVWIQIYLFSLRGYKPSTTFTYITALIPIVAMLVIAGLAVSLDGASLGIQHLFSPTPHVYSIPSPSKHLTLHAPTRRLHMHPPSAEISDVALLSAGVPHGSAINPAPEITTNGKAARVPVSSIEQTAGKRRLNSAAAPDPPVITHRPSPKTAAAAARQQEGSSSSNNNIQKSDVISTILSFWPRWLAAGSHPVWGEAAAQVFFSLGVFQGVVAAYASHKHLTENVLVDAAAAAMTNLCMSLLAAVATFAVAGHVAKGLGAVQAGARAGADLSVLQDIQGSQLVFVLYPLAFASLPVGVAQVTCILCFFALLLLGIMSVVGLVQPLMGLLRCCPRLERCPRWKIVAAICAMGFLTGMPFCTRGGLLLLEAADYHWTVVGLIFIGCCESIAFGWLYGAGRQAQCIGCLPVLLHGITYWMAVLLAASLLFLSPPPYNTLKVALSVSFCVAIAGAAAALWCCPWKERRTKDMQEQQQDERQKDEQKMPMPQQEHAIDQQQAQQQTQQQIQQTPIKRKGKAQTGITEKSRVKFNNGCAGSSGDCDKTHSVDSSSRVNQNDPTLQGQTHNGATSSSHVTRSGASSSTSTEGGAPHVVGSGSSSSTSSEDGVIHSTRTGDTSSRSSEGGAIHATGSGTSSEGDATGNEPVYSSIISQKSNGPIEGNRIARNSENTSSQHSGDNTCAESHSANQGAGRGSSSNSTTGVRHSSNTVTAASSINNSCEALSNPSNNVSSAVRGDVSRDRVVLCGGQERNQPLHGRRAVDENSSDTHSASEPNSSSSNRNTRVTDMHGQGDAVLVLDTKKLSAADTTPKQHSQRYKSPRGRSSRRKRGRRVFVFIKRNGEALTFAACVFWLFVGNVEHLRKNLNAITCSGHRILRLWPPWSILIRYIIPTILMLLVVQEMPQLLYSLTRSNLAPSAGSISYSSALLGATPHPSHLQQIHATLQQHPLLQHLPSEQQQLQQLSPQQQFERETLQRSTTFPGTSVSWRSLVAIDAFTLGALFLLVGLIVIGLLLPHVWGAFIPKERRRPISKDPSSVASSRV